MKKHYCKCGAGFNKLIWLREHIGICNPHWPRSSPNDEHGAVECKAIPKEQARGTGDFIND